MFLLDTNACIHFLNGTHPSLSRRVLASGPDLLAVSALTVAELEFGAARSSRPRANRERLAKFFRERPCFRSMRTAALTSVASRPSC